MGKRADGEGSIHKFSRKRKDGTVWEGWQGSVSLGYKPSGKRDRRTVYGRTQAEVKLKLEALKKNAHEGVHTDGKLTVAAFLERWLAHKDRTVKPRSAEFYRYNTNKYIVPRIGKKKLEKLTPLDVQGMMSDIADTVGVSTANKCRTTLCAALVQAVRWQVVARNVVAAVEKLSEKPREMALWTPAQAAHFLDTATSHRLYALFYLAMSTGMRRGELLGLRWQDVGTDAVTVRQTIVPVAGKLTVSTPKTAKGKRRVAVSPDVIAVLTDHHRRQEAESLAVGEAWADSGLVFTTEIGTAIHPDSVKRHWLALQEAAGLPRVRLHDLRHLHVSLLIRQGIDARSIADRVGHSRTSMTMDVYAHLFDEQRVAAAVSLLDLLPRSDPAAAN